MVALALGAGQDLARTLRSGFFQLILLSETGRFAGPFPNGHDGLLKRVNGDGLRGLRPWYRPDCLAENPGSGRAWR